MNKLKDQLLFPGWPGVLFIHRPNNQLSNIQAHIRRRFPNELEQVNGSVLDQVCESVWMPVNSQVRDQVLLILRGKIPEKFGERILEGNHNG